MEKNANIPDVYHLTNEDKYVYFGAFPQDLKEPSVSVSETADPCGYYLGSDGAYYARLKADPSCDQYAFLNGEPIEEGKEYWFKVCPVKWCVLHIRDGVAFLFSDKILAACSYEFGSDPVLADMKKEKLWFSGNENVYEPSGIRHWLIRDFFLAAFSLEEQALILKMKVDNSVASTNETWNHHICEDTEDTVFLLSAAEIVSKTFGIDMLSSDSREAYKIPTDYARAMGASRMCAEGFSPWRGNKLNDGPYGWWWTRSPYPDYEDSAKACDGSMIGIHDVLNCRGGVVPAVRIKFDRR